MESKPPQSLRVVRILHCVVPLQDAGTRDALLNGMMKDSTVKQCKDWMSVKETILLVEDEDSIRFTARMFLKTNGYNVMEAGSGSEAVAIWERNKSKIDLVVTDLVMPGGITGLRLAQRL